MTNNAPTITTVSKIGIEDTVLLFNVTDFTNNFDDADEDSLTKIEVASLPTNGLLKLLDIEVSSSQEIIAENLSNLTFTPLSSWYGTTDFYWRGHDGTEYSNYATVDINIESVNDLPEIVYSLEDKTAQPDVPFEMIIPSDMFYDHDQNDALNITISKSDGSSLPSWLTVSKDIIFPEIIKILYYINAQSFTIKDKYIYSIDTNEFRITDISSISTPGIFPNFVGQLDDEECSFSEGIAIQGNYVYVGSYCIGAGLKIINITDHTTPNFINVVNTGGTSNKIIAQGNYVYIAEGGSNKGLKIVDITNPETPSLIGEWSTGSQEARDLEVLNNIVFLAVASSGLKIIDVKDRTDPKSIGTFNENDGCSNRYTNSVAIRGNYAYIIDLDTFCKRGLEIVNVADPTTPVLVKNVNGFSGREIVISQNYAYIRTDLSEERIRIYDITNRTEPLLIEKYSSDNDKAFAISKGYLYLGDNSNGMEIIEGIGAAELILRGTPTQEDAGTLNLKVTATDDENEKISSTFSITVQSEKELFLVNNSLTVETLFPVIPISTENLGAVGVNKNDSEIVFSITNIQHGQFELAIWSDGEGLDNPGLFIRQFTQQQVKENEIIFLHDRSNIAPTYKVSVSNGNLTTGSILAEISFFGYTPFFDELHVNTYTTSNQILPAVAKLNDEEFVITWNGYGSSGTSEVYGQIFSTDGTKEGNEFQVNTYTTDSQDNSAVAKLNENKFVVAWESGSTTVCQQIHYVNGSKCGEESCISSGSFKQYVSIMGLSNEKYIIAWIETTAKNIHSQMYHTNGTSYGEEFQVNTYTGIATDRKNPSIAELSNEKFIITWARYSEGSSNIYGQLFYLNGTRCGNETKINDFIGSYYNYDPSVSKLPDGRFVIAWQLSIEGEHHYRWQMFYANGTQCGEVVSEAINNIQNSNPFIIGLNNEKIVVTWAGNDPLYFRPIWGQIFNTDGSKYGERFCITPVYREQNHPDIAKLDEEKFVITWDTYSAPDDDQHGIFGRIFGYDFAPQLIKNELTLYQGDEVILSSYNINVTDVDDDRNNTVIEVDKVLYGQFELVNGTGEPITKFTYGQIIEGNIQFKHYGGTGIPGYCVSVSDRKLKTSCSPAKIKFNNNIPVISTIYKLGEEDSTLNFNVDDFANSFSDIDGDSLTKIKVISLPNNGILKLSETLVEINQEIKVNDLNNLTFEPTVNWNGETNFSWKGHDGTVYSETAASVDITIDPVNDAPTITTVSKTGTEDITLTFTASDFTNKFSDIESDSLTKVKIITLPSNGVLKLSGTSVVENQEIDVADIVNLIFEPNSNWNGNTNFEWKGFDGTEYSTESANVGITINAVNDAPIVVTTLQNQTTHHSTQFEILIPYDIFSDSDGDVLFINIKQTNGLSLPTWLSLIYNSFVSSLVGSLTTNSVSGYGLEIIENYIYLPDSIAGLKIIDITNPTSPSLAGSCWVAEAQGVAVSGNYAYVANAVAAGLKTIDITNPEAPILLDTSVGTGRGYAIKVIENYAYLSVETFGLKICNVSNPAAPSVIGEFDTGNGFGLDVVGDFAYIADGAGRIRIINVANPTSPDSVGLFDTANAGMTTAVKVEGNYLYVAGWNYLEIINVLNPASPTLVGSLSLPGGYCYDIKIAEKYAYVVDGGGLNIINIADPSYPYLVGSAEGGYGAKGVAIAGNYIYTSHGVLRVYEGTKPIGVLLSGIPTSSDIGILNLNVTASDRVEEVSAEFSINVLNDAPIVSVISKSGMEDTPLIFNTTDFTSHYNDTEGSELTKIKIITLPTDGILKLSNISVIENQEINSEDLFNLIFEPNSNWYGNTTFEWKGHDGIEYSESSANVNIIIGAVNDAPTVTNIYKIGTEDTVLTFNITDFTNHFNDIDNDFN